LTREIGFRTVVVGALARSQKIAGKVMFKKKDRLYTTPAAKQVLPTIHEACSPPFSNILPEVDKCIQ
jgi:hypothetical protein